mmetsp:Transcript_2791/g.5894  ORF Transcript_2791/g.5894 Transcript_2791/m.5894 type:complete len:114 (-) Transcript_2791:12-353(-)
MSMGPTCAMGATGAMKVSSSGRISIGIAHAGAAAGGREMIEQLLQKAREEGQLPGGTMAAAPGPSAQGSEAAAEAPATPAPAPAKAKGKGPGKGPGKGKGPPAPAAGATEAES